MMIMTAAGGCSRDTSNSQGSSLLSSSVLVLLASGLEFEYSIGVRQAADSKSGNTLS